MANFDSDFILQNMMGPCSMMLAQEIAPQLELKPGMRVLDLGCGKGLTSIFLAKEYGVTVFATDLWISATDNYKNIKKLGLEDKIIPIHADARALPYADDYFDVVISVDAYHYFGTDEIYLDNYLVPLIKKGGKLAVACPGFTKEFADTIPESLQQFCEYGDFLSFHSHLWWRKLWERTRSIEVLASFNLECSDSAWEKWISAKDINEVAKGDVPFFEAAKGLLTTAAIIARKR